jgi:hypothetical protein
VNFQGKRRRCPRLVVVFQKASELVLIIQPSVKVFTHGTGMFNTKAVVEPLIVGVVETLLLSRPLQVPVNLGHKCNAGYAFAHTLDCLRPEWLRWDAPGSVKDFRQNQHGHVAAQAIALASDSYQFADHRFLRGGVAVVQLKRVGPAREVRIATVGQEKVATLAVDPRVVLRGAGEVQF